MDGRPQASPVEYVAAGIAMASSGLIAAGVFNNLHGSMGLAGWQWLFIIEPATGAFLALIGPFFIPDFPGSKTGAGVYWLFGSSEECCSSSSCSGPCDRAWSESSGVVWPEACSCRHRDLGFREDPSQRIRFSLSQN
jgi:hypothetical protein